MLRGPAQAASKGIVTDLSHSVPGHIVRTQPCAYSCADFSCQICRFVAFYESLRSLPCLSLRVGTTPAQDRNAEIVCMDFFMQPDFVLRDTSAKTMNQWTLVAFGLGRESRRSTFSSAKAMRSMYKVDRDTSFGTFMDKTFRLGWHDQLAQRLAAGGMALAPYKHQSAAMLAMLKFENRLADNFANAPEFRRGGVKAFLRESLVKIGDHALACSLSGALITPEVADAAIARARGGLLAFPPGVGKTFICIALAVLTWQPGTLAAIIRAPTHLLLQWRSELRRFVPHACIVDHEAGRPTATETQPTFLLVDNKHMTQDLQWLASSERPGIRAARTFVDEAHDAPVDPRRPAEGEATWTVTATPFFARSQHAESLYSVLAKVPRHHGIPHAHGQLLNMFKVDAGTVYRELVLNLHELDSILPPAHHRRIFTSEDRNAAFVDNLTALVLERSGNGGYLSHAHMQNSIATILRMLQHKIRAAAERGTVLYTDELLYTIYGYRSRRQRFPEHGALQPASAQMVTGAIAGDDCPICLTSMAGGSDEDTGPVTLLPCRHMLHHECLRGWVQVSGDCRCPMCRAAFHAQQLVAVPHSGTALGDAAEVQNDVGVWAFDRVHAMALQLIQEHAARREGKVIVFMAMDSAPRLGVKLRRAGISYVNCIEATTAEWRAAAIDDFVKGSAFVLLVDPRSEAGLNLTVANMVISYSGHSGSMDQMKGRVQRLGQQHAVHFVQMVVDGHFEVGV